MAKDWGTDWKFDQIQRGIRYEDHTKLPYQQFVMAMCTAVLYLRRDNINGGKAIFLEVNSGNWYDADEFMAHVGYVTAMHMKSCVLVGDDRPVFDTEEEEQAFLASQGASA